MEKIKSKMRNVRVLALSFALCIFYQSTAFGIDALIDYKNTFNIDGSIKNIMGAHMFMETASGNTEEVVYESKDSVNSPMKPDGGPDQPEVQSFTPIGTSDMVDPFSGDFSYNIPLMDVDGYPINIAYNAGASMDQEASWVGLGWNLNPGVVNRAMRGIPDDFNGSDKIVKKQNQKKNWTIGGSIGVDLEIYGFAGSKTAVNDTSAGINLNASMSINFNNYNGFGASHSLGFNISTPGGLSAGLGFAGNSSGGATISPNLGLAFKGGNDKIKNSLNLRSQLNSRSGLGNTTISYNRTKDQLGMWVQSRRGHTQTGTNKSKLPISSSYNFMQSTYTPSITMPMKSGGATFSFKLGTDLIGFDGSATFTGFYNFQELKSKEVISSSYGYMNLAKGTRDSDAMLDFNRENDGVFTKNIETLPNTNLTYDIFSVSGQGVAGSYRPVRLDIGHVFDAKQKNKSLNGSSGLEAGLGATSKGGMDISATHVSSNSGDWNESGNRARNSFKFKNDNFYFREANELAVNSDPTHFSKIGGSDAVRFDVASFRKINNTLKKSNGQNLASLNSYDRSTSERRNQVTYTLTNKELKQGLGIQDLDSDAYAQTHPEVDHHIGQFTVLNVEGSRYVYGIAAYSHKQKNVSFAVGEDRQGNNGFTTLECPENLVGYAPNINNSVNNLSGIDNYYNSVETPAFAHSYLLTSLLNADYVDSDAIKGPSEGDLGGYLTFDYQKVNNYKWRNPIDLNKASYDEGYNTDPTDDKGHYLYGEKELWYVNEIKSKNHIAKFYTSPREDAISANGENGGINVSGSSMVKLDSIELYSLPDYTNVNTIAIPLKTVHFEYNYELCDNYSSNVNGDGKLTLTKVYFTYQDSDKGRFTPYAFTYGFNPDYNSKHIDRWNTYKESENCGVDLISDELRPSDFPYVGFDKAASDLNAAAWNLSKINLPSGGEINVEYESDDYTYVQHKEAKQMLKIVGVETLNSIETSGTISLSNDNLTNAKIYFELIPHPQGGYYENISDYVKPGELIYFRSLLKFGNNKYDFVPGYGTVGETAGSVSIETLPGGAKVGCIAFVGERLKDNGASIYNPIAVTGVQFARIHLSKFIPPSNTAGVNANSNLSGLVDAIIGAYTSYQELFIGPNKPVWNAKIGTDLVIGKSWLRLGDPTKSKLGGGHRVKSIRMTDGWETLTNNEMTGYEYGQVYDYTTIEGTSSGVASYEPQIGGDENPWNKPYFSSKRMLLAPDERNYQEAPFGEQFFPSARVGYSRVTIKDLPRANVKRTATGKVVHEFYTARDFPTITERTDLKVERFKLPVFAVFFSLMFDEMAASQGFVVETNDMHGKQKRQSVYAEDQSEPITRVTYEYQSTSATIENISTGKLINEVEAIEPNGDISTVTIGLNYEGVADFRKNESKTVSGTAEINVNFTLPFFLIPTLYGSGSFEKTGFRSATFTKVIERFGIQNKTIAEDLGSKVETENLAYDARTGTVLVTKTKTNFEDDVYSFTYPAHWHYDQMGQAYQNIGKQALDVTFVNGGSAQINDSQFSKGDEVAILLTSSSTAILGWVVGANSTGVQILLKDGSPLEGSYYKVKVLRSGRRNIQTTPVGSIALRENPLNNLTGNVFEKVLQAGAVEYSDDWRTFCECFLDEQENNYTTNPYVLGTQGTWRPVASYVHLSGRTQDFVNTNSNIRQDGMFTSFSPFYRLSNGLWNINRQNWTYTSSVTEFSPYGQALETVDALDRYSSSMFGYNQTLPIAVAANTRYSQLGFDGFEDYDYINCSDDHFKITSEPNVTDEDAHTGRKSVKVASGTPVTFNAVFEEDCGPECAIEVNTVNKPGNEGNPMSSTSVTFSNGQPIYNITYEVVSGNPQISFTNGGDGLIISYHYANDPNQHVKITVTDALGCQKYVEIKN